MKTAISILDDLFADAEQMARRLNRPRSRLYSDAVREYLTRHNPDGITEALDRVCDLVGAEADPAMAVASRRLLAQVEW